MSFVPKVEISKPRRSTQNLSFINRTSIAPGVLVPVMVKEALPGDRFHVTLDSLMKTLPLEGPLMGSFRVQFDTFFCPVRFYNALLHDDRYNFDPDNVEFPTMALEMLDNDAADPANEYYAGVHPSSLYHHLGIPENFVRPVTDGSGSRWRSFNAIPLLAYYEIFRNYYANTQDVTSFVVGGNSAGLPDLRVAPLTDIDAKRLQILQLTAEDVGANIQVLGTSPGFYNRENIHYPLGGMALRTYMPDRFSAYVNPGRYADTLTAARVDTSQGFFDMDGLRLADKLNRMLQKTLIAGGRYSDWQYVQYGQSLRRVVEVPSFVHTTSYELMFEDVVQTSDSGSADNPLGSLGGRGVGSVFGRSFTYKCTEHGFLMTIASVCPRVDYFQGIKSYMYHRRLSDVHIPTLDGIGFQDLLVDNFYAQSTVGSTALGGSVDYSLAYAKQPAWTEYMTDVNEVHGDFAEPTKLMYLTLARRFGGVGTSQANDFTSYVFPHYYNYAFADSSLTGQNFWLQCSFKVYVKRAISKRVMPNL